MKIEIFRPGDVVYFAENLLDPTLPIRYGEVVEVSIRVFKGSGENVSQYLHVDTGKGIEIVSILEAFEEEEDIRIFWKRLAYANKKIAVRHGNSQVTTKQ